MEHNFESIIQDFVRDLTRVFPEYAEKFASIQCDDELRKYALTVYPERFFDIVNCQLSDEAMYLPGINFKELFEAPGLSESSKQTMWKYLQLILFSVVGSVDNASRFGESLNVFENMDETELQSKLQETFAGLEDFFKGTSFPTAGTDGSFKNANADDNVETNDNANSNEDASKGFKLPNPEVLQEHMRTLMEGKIGKLAKELTEEFSEDMKEVFDESDENMDIKDVMSKFMKDPKKLMAMMKKITDRLQSKLKNGEISQDELMQEVASLVEKFKGLDKNGSMMEMFTKGPLAKMFAGMAGGQGLQMLQRAGKQSEMKERLRKKMELKQAQKQALSANTLVLPEVEAYTPSAHCAPEPKLTDDQLVELFKKKRNKNKNKK